MVFKQTWKHVNVHRISKSGRCHNPTDFIINFINLKPFFCGIPIKSRTSAVALGEILVASSVPIRAQRAFFRRFGYQRLWSIFEKILCNGDGQVFTIQRSGSEIEQRSEKGLLFLLGQVARTSPSARSRNRCHQTCWFPVPDTVTLSTEAAWLILKQLNGRSGHMEGDVSGPTQRSQSHQAGCGILRFFRPVPTQNPQLSPGLPQRPTSFGLITIQTIQDVRAVHLAAASEAKKKLQKTQTVESFLACASFRAKLRRALMPQSFLKYRHRMVQEVFCHRTSIRSMFAFYVFLWKNQRILGKLNVHQPFGALRSEKNIPSLNFKHLTFKKIVVYCTSSIFDWLSKETYWNRTLPRFLPQKNWSKTRSPRISGVQTHRCSEVDIAGEGHGICGTQACETQPFWRPKDQDFVSS